MNKVAVFASFVLGAAAGSAATWFIVKKKYEQLAQEEIDSVKEAFSRRNKIEEIEEEAEEEAEVVNEILEEKRKSVKEYAEELRRSGYTNYANADILEESADRPHVISPEEFGELEDQGFETISLTYYADQVLADDDDRVITNVDDIVGYDSLTHFGEYEDDSVFVRNERLKCDYEILLDQRTYADVLREQPYKADM